MTSWLWPERSVGLYTRCMGRDGVVQPLADQLAVAVRDRVRDITGRLHTGMYQLSSGLLPRVIAVGTLGRDQISGAQLLLVVCEEVDVLACSGRLVLGLECVSWADPREAAAAELYGPGTVVEVLDKLIASLEQVAGLVRPSISKALGSR